MRVEGIHQRVFPLMELDKVVRAAHLAPARVRSGSRDADSGCGFSYVLGGDDVRVGHGTRL